MKHEHINAIIQVYIVREDTVVEERLPLRQCSLHKGRARYFLIYLSVCYMIKSIATYVQPAQWHDLYLNWKSQEFKTVKIAMYSSPTWRL